MRRVFGSMLVVLSFILMQVIVMSLLNIIALQKNIILSLVICSPFILAIGLYYIFRD